MTKHTVQNNNRPASKLTFSLIGGVHPSWIVLATQVLRVICLSPAALHQLKGRENSSEVIRSAVLHHQPQHGPLLYLGSGENLLNLHPHL